MLDRPPARDVLGAVHDVTATGAAWLWHDPCMPLGDLLPTGAHPRPVRRSGGAIDILVPRVASDSEKSLSRIYGLGPFPFHTDCAHHPVPPRFGMMRLRSESSDRATFFVDGQPLIADEPLHRRAVCTVVGGQMAFHTGPYLRVDQRVGLRWDPGCMSPADFSFAAAVDRFAGVVESQPVLTIQWTRDLVVVWDNWRMLHARGPSERDGSGPVRELERALFDL